MISEVRGTTDNIFPGQDDTEKNNKPVNLVGKTSPSVREVWGSITESVTSNITSDKVSSTACHGCDVSSKLCCKALSRGDGPTTRYTLTRNYGMLEPSRFDSFQPSNHTEEIQQLWKTAKRGCAL